MIKVTTAAAVVAAAYWVSSISDVLLVPPSIARINHFEISAAGRMVMSLTVHESAPPEGVQAVLVITVEGPDDHPVCQGQRIVNLRPDKAREKIWFVNTWFDKPCDLPIPAGSIVHATWVPFDRDSWSIVSVQYIVPTPDPRL